MKTLLLMLLPFMGFGQSMFPSFDSLERYVIKIKSGGKPSESEAKALSIAKRMDTIPVLLLVVNKKAGNMAFTKNALWLVNRQRQSGVFVQRLYPGDYLTTDKKPWPKNLFIITEIH